MEIRKDQIVFKLKDGSSIFLDKADYDTIINQMKTDAIVRMLIDMPSRVYFECNVNEKTIQNLYRVLTEQKSMPEDLRNNYLKVILELSKEPNKAVESFEEGKKNLIKQ